MFKTRINLVTWSDVKNFVDITTTIEGELKLTDGTGYTINAKSMLGCLAALEWNDLYVISEEDVYSKIMEFAR